MKGLLAALAAADPLDSGVCVYHQSALVSTAGYIQRPPTSPPLPLTQTLTFTAPPPSVRKSRTQFVTSN